VTAIFAGQIYCDCLLACVGDSRQGVRGVERLGGCQGREDFIR